MHTFIIIKLVNLTELLRAWLFLMNTADLLCFSLNISEAGAGSLPSPKSATVNGATMLKLYSY